MSNKGANKANTQNSNSAPKQSGVQPAGSDLESKVRAVREITHWPDADIKRVLEKYHYDTLIATNSIIEGREGQYEWTEVPKKGEKKVEKEVKSSPKQPNGDFKRGDGRGKPFKKTDRPERTDRGTSGPIGDIAPRRQEGRGRARPPFNSSDSDSQYSKTRAPGGLSANGTEATRAIDTPQQYTPAPNVPAASSAPAPAAPQARPQTQAPPAQSSVVSNQTGSWANRLSQQPQPQVLATQANGKPSGSQAQSTATTSLPASVKTTDVPAATGAVGSNQPDSNNVNSFPTQSRAAYQQEGASPTPSKAWKPKDAAPVTNAASVTPATTSTIPPTTSTTTPAVAPAVSSGTPAASTLPQQSSAPSSQSFHSAPITRPGLSFNQRGSQPVSLPQSALSQDGSSLSFQFGSLSVDNRFPVKLPQSTPQHVQSQSQPQSQPQSQLQSHSPLTQLQQYHVYQPAPLHQQVDPHDQPLTQQYGGYPQYVHHYGLPDDHRLPNAQSAYYNEYSQAYGQQLPSTSSAPAGSAAVAGTATSGATDSPKFGGGRGGATSYRGPADQANSTKPDAAAPHDPTVPLGYNMPAGAYPGHVYYPYGGGYGYQQQSYAPPPYGTAYGMQNQYGKQAPTYSQPSQPSGPPSAAAYPPTTGQRPPAASAAYGEPEHIDYKQQQYFPTYLQPEPQAVKGSAPQQSAAQGLGTSPPPTASKSGFSDNKNAQYQRESFGTSYYNPQAAQSFNGSQYQQSGFQHPSQQHVYQPSQQGNTRAYHGA